MTRTVAAKNGRKADAYEIASWSPRSPLDDFAVALHRFLLAWRVPIAYLILLAFTVGWLYHLAPILVTRDGILLASAAILPVTILMIGVWALDRTTLEPLDLVLRTYLVGAALAVIAAMANTQLAYLPDYVLYPLVVGPGEELLKLLAVYLIAFRRRAFDHAVDGLFYGVAAAAGFAAIENVTHVVGATVSQGIGGAWDLVLLRTFVSTPAHLVWSAVAGFYLGLARFVPAHAGALVTKGVVIAAASHALYDLLMTKLPAYGIVLAIAMTVGLLAWLAYKVHAYYAYFEISVPRAKATRPRASTRTRRPRPART